jgi:hypothetical protein
MKQSSSTAKYSLAWLFCKHFLLSIDRIGLNRQRNRDNNKKCEINEDKNRKLLSLCKADLTTTLVG